MSAAFHRGISQELRRRLQTAGIRIEESDAQRALAGAAVVNVSSPAQEVIREISIDVWRNRFTQMPRWENEHPGESPFPPIFAQAVLEVLHRATINGTLEEGILEAIKMAEAELEL